MAARKVQLKDNSGNKAYPVTSSACVGMSDGSGSLDEKISGIISNSGYVTCTAAAGTAAKTVTQAGFALSTNCRLIIRMTNFNTAASPTLNINNTGAKPLYYNGEIASADNTWEAGEVLDIYYDGTNYQASNIQGGSGAGRNQILEWNTDAATTRLQIAQRKRKAGMIVSYNNPDSGWINEQYIGTSFADTNWKNDINWKTIVDKSITDKLESDIVNTNLSIDNKISDAADSVSQEITSKNNALKEELSLKDNALESRVAAVESGKQDNLIPGNNINIDPETKVISTGITVLQETGDSNVNPMSQKSVTEELSKIEAKIDEQKTDVNAAKDAAIESINKEKENAIADFSAQRVTPEMLSESTKQLINASGGGTINNLPDDEDITSTGGETPVLKFKDRKHDMTVDGGLGYKILRKGTAVREQITDENTIYEVRYDFDISESSPDGYIDFNDAEVERICIEKFSSDGKGVTQADVENVTGLDGEFNGNKLIETFHELKLFTGLTSIGAYQFSGMGSNFKAISLPPTITSISNYAFRNNDSIAFDVLLYSEVPPTLGWASLNGMDKATFYVPDGSVEAYKAATYWSDAASRIYPMSEYSEGSEAGSVKTLIMPSNSGLLFNGGSLRNGVIRGDGTYIASRHLYRIFADDVSFEGTFRNNTAYPEWFGAESTDKTGTYSSGDTMSLAPETDSLADSSEAINKSLKVFGKTALRSGRAYRITSTVEIPYGKTLVIPANSIIAAYMDGAGLTVKTVDKADSTFSEDTVLEEQAVTLAENQFISTDSMAKAISVSSMGNIEGNGTLFLGKSTYTIGVLVKGWAYSYLDMTFSPHICLRTIGGGKATCYAPDVRDMIGTTPPQASTGEDGQYYYDKSTYSYYHKESGAWVKQSPSYNPRNQFNTSMRFDVPNDTRIIDPYIELWDMYGFRGIEIITYGDGWFNESIIKGTISNKHGSFISVFAGGGGVSIHHWEGISVQVDKGMQHDSRIFFASKCNVVGLGMVWDLAWISPPRVQTAFELCAKAGNVDMGSAVDAISYVADNGVGNVYTRHPKYTEERAIVPMMFENLLDGISLWYKSILCGSNNIWCMTLNTPKTFEELVNEDHSAYAGIYPSKYMFDGDNSTYFRVIDTANNLYSTSFPINSDNQSSQIKTVNNQCWLEIDYKPSTNVGNTCFVAVEGYNTTTDIRPLKAYNPTGTWGNAMTYKVFIRIEGGPTRQHPVVHFFCLDGTNNVTVDIVALKLWQDGSNVSFRRLHTIGSEADKPDSPRKGFLYFNEDTGVLEVNTGDAENPVWIGTSGGGMQNFTEINIDSVSPVIRLKTSEIYKCGVVDSIAVIPDKNNKVLGFIQFTTNAKGTTNIIYANFLSYENAALKPSTTYLIQVSGDTAAIHELVTRTMPIGTITFEDAYCEYVCASKWGSDGFITLEQAAAVEELTKLNASGITSFDELEYFTGITVIPGMYFQGYGSLEKVTFPANVTTIGEHVFRWAYNVVRLVCKAVTPPTLNASQQYMPSLIYVPDENVEDYKAASGWSKYADRISPLSGLDEK